MNSNYTIKMLGISLLMLLLLGVLAFALRPLHYRQKVSVCTLDGDVLEVEFEVTLRRYLWKPAESHGRIIIDGVEYVSMNDLYSRESIKNNAGSHIFLIPGQYAISTAENDQIVLAPIEDRLDYFMLSLVRSGETDTYFGPAASQVEAQKVSEKWMHK